MSFKTGYQLLAKKGNEAFEINTDYKWMSGCGICCFIFFSLIMIFFIASCGQGVGNRVATLTYSDDAPLPNFKIPFTNQAFPAKFRVNLNKEDVNDNIADDLGTNAFGNEQISDFIC